MTMQMRLTGLMAVVVLALGGPVSGAGRFPWLTDLDEARELAAGEAALDRVSLRAMN